MNEQRLQDYLNLIERILAQPEEFFNTPPELRLDPGLIETMKQVATMLLEQGEVNKAEFLTNIAQSASATIFLQQVLNAALDSEGDPNVMYPFLDTNLDKLNDYLVTLLQNTDISATPLDQAEIFARAVALFCTTVLEFDKGNKEINLEIAIAGYQSILEYYANQASQKKLWADIQNNLGIAYLARIRAAKIENLEQAIIYFENALRVYNRHNFPEDWARVQSNLGVTYLDRIRGKKAENIEKSIAYFQKALEIKNYEISPQQWAKIQNDLGLAYRNRIQGQRADNLEKSIIHFANALLVYNSENNPKFWATIQTNLSGNYIERIAGKKADNIEQAIVCCQKALKVCTYEVHPEVWVAIQNNLGIAYGERILGNKAENLEQAIVYHQNTLKVYTRQALPDLWAKTQGNLAGAYQERLHGKRLENLEQAIEYYKNALQIYTRDAYPQDWASTQGNLATAYAYRIQGVKADNIEQAISYCQAALQIYTLEDFPERWATNQSHLAGLYIERISGDRADNIEQAISYLNNALQVLSSQAYPQDWARIQDSLGIAYSNRIRGDRVENLERAIACCNNALQVLTREAFPESWAKTQHNLATIYTNYTERHRRENLEKAIVCHKNALEVFIRNIFPIDWASSQMGLGTTYIELISEEEAENNNGLRNEQLENLNQALSYYQNALKVYTREDLPEDWALLQQNLAIIYIKRIRFNLEENLNLAVEYCEKALEVFTREAFPLDHLQILYNLGLAYEAAKQFHNAYKLFASAIDTVEFLRNEIVSGNQAKRKLVEKWRNLYRRMVRVCLEIATSDPIYYDKAIEYVERNKARNLLENLNNRDLLPKGNIPTNVLVELQRLQQQIRTEQNRLDSGEMKITISNLLLRLSENEKNSTSISSDSPYISQLQQQFDDFIDKNIKPIDPKFSLTQKIKPITFQQIRELLPDSKTALIEWYIYENCAAFVVTRDKEHPVVWQFPMEKSKKLLTWGDDYVIGYLNSKEKWREQLESQITNLTELIELEQVISLVPETCDRVILVPYFLLNLFPLHALPLPDRSCLLDRFPRGVIYAPSCQLLQTIQNQQRPHFSNLFAVQNPTDDLIFTNLEVETIRSFFPQTEVLVKQAATKAAFNANQNLSSAHSVHLSCHGSFNLISPMESALLLANKEHLTLAEIFNLNLNQCRLVTLSACETGMTDITSISDEYIGLPSGFLYAGSSNVVSSLWAVNDLSTSFLMIKFYENLRKRPTLEVGDVGIALNEAQKWLRDLTSEECEKRFDELQPQIDQILAQLPKKESRLVEAAFKGARKQIRDRSPHPFANPYYWAAFTATGL